MSLDVPMTNIRKEPCGGWMIVLLVVVSFIIGCFDRMCQPFLSGFVIFFFNHSFWPCCSCGFLTFPCLWEISCSSQMINGTVSWLLDSDRIFKWSYYYFSSRMLSGGSWIVGVSVVDSFEFCSIYITFTNWEYKVPQNFSWRLNF